MNMQLSMNTCSITPAGHEGELHPHSCIHEVQLQPQPQNLLVQSKLSPYGPSHGLAPVAMQVALKVNDKGQQGLSQTAAHCFQN